MKIIVGSKALEYFGFNRSTPKDIDFWRSESRNDLQGDCKVLPIDILKLVPTKDGYATPDAIYTIKCSHLGWSNPLWDKHKKDIIWLRNKGCSIIPDLYKRLVTYWCSELGDKSFLSLDQNKKEFFTDMVNYKYDHDYLHKLVAHPNPPMYTKCLKNKQEVLVDKEKFSSMPFAEQVRMFKEEITVIACERWLLNDYWNGNISWYQSYILSLQKTITNLTKNWATDFIVLNLEYFIKPEYSYFRNVIEQLGENIMSNVDMGVFKELMEEEGVNTDLENVIYCLCEGDFGEIVEWNGSYEEYKSERENISNKYGYKHLDQEGGGEGGSEYCYGIFELKGKIYKAEYSYYSYHGHEYDDIVSTLREVKPVEKTITVYE